VFPSCAEDAKGLLKAAARSEDPVIFLEHKGLYRRMHARVMEPDADYVLPFGRGRIRREGTDATIVTMGYECVSCSGSRTSIGSTGEVD
jgi:2-oxoisovalerate dehydrogenase E1 component